MSKLRTISEKEHGLNRKFVDRNAVTVLDKLVKAGHEAYLVGGAVRDALLGQKPKDFDVATSAHPEEVKKVLRNSLIIGKRFKLVHARFGRDIIEVATFRSSHKEVEAQDDVPLSKSGKERKTVSDEGLIMRDNVYGTLEEDAVRRDFTINAMYYDWHKNVILDYHQGYEDTQRNVMRLIGEPEVRYQEDPVRMLRAVRFMGKLGSTLSPEAKAPIKPMADMLAHIPVARLFEEYLKLFHSGSALQTFHLLREYHLFHFIFPQTSLRLEEDKFLLTLIETALSDTDKRVNEGMHVNPGYLIGVFLWGDFTALHTKKFCKDLPPLICINKAASRVLKSQRKSTSIPKRLSALVYDVWEMQIRLPRIQGKQPFRLLEHPKYRAAYDFMCLRYRAGETELAELVDWWTIFQEASGSQRKEMAGLSSASTKSKSAKKKVKSSQQANSQKTKPNNSKKSAKTSKPSEFSRPAKASKSTKTKQVQNTPKPSEPVKKKESSSRLSKLKRLFTRSKSSKKDT